MDRFLLAENPNKEADDRLFVLHTVSPRILVECICLNEAPGDEDMEAIFSFYQFVNSDGVLEKWQLIIRQYYDAIDVDDVADEEVPRYRKTIDKAWRWFRSYLEWEDDNLDMNEIASQN